MRITVLAGGNRADPYRVQDSATTLVGAMSGSGVGRVIITRAYPIVARRPAHVMALLRRVLATAYADVARAEAVIADSDLDWTIVRLNGSLMQGPLASPTWTPASSTAPPA